jgi:hypothetical protein
MDGYPDVTNDNWGKGVQGKGENEKTKSFSKLSQPIPFAQIKTETAQDAFKSVLRSAGASHRRDAVDKRIVDETRTGQEQFGTTFSGGGKGIIDSPEEVGGWPFLKQGKFRLIPIKMAFLMNGKQPMASIPMIHPMVIHILWIKITPTSKSILIRWWSIL